MQSPGSQGTGPMRTDPTPAEMDTASGTPGVAAVATAADHAGRAAVARQRAQQRVAEIRNGMEARRQLAVPARPGMATRPGQVDGATVLGYAGALLRRYARFPSQGAMDAAVLWAAHTHARDASGMLTWEATGRLMFLSSEPGSGKSRALELTGMLCPAVFGLDAEPTEAGLVYTIASERATVLLDEADVLFGSGKRKAAIRGVLNSGYTRQGTVLRMRGGKGERARVFGAVALAGLDVMKTATGETLAPLFSRSIVIRMRKAADPVPRLDAEARKAGAMLRTALGAWIGGMRDELAAARPEVPEGIANRSEEIWTPLLAIAEAAGGDWPERARRACEELALLGDTTEDAAEDAMAGLAGIPWLS